MTIIRSMRSNALGIDGTIREAREKAPEFLPHISILRKVIKSLEFKEWIQGHHRHELITYDGGHYIIRPIVDSYGQVGMQVSCRASRQFHTTLMEYTGIENIDEFILFLKLLARSKFGSVGCSKISST